MTKGFLFKFLVALLLLSLFSGCSQKESTDSSQELSQKEIVEAQRDLIREQFNRSLALGEEMRNFDYRDLEVLSVVSFQNTSKDDRQITFTIRPGASRNNQSDVDFRNMSLVLNVSSNIYTYSFDDGVSSCDSVLNLSKSAFRVLYRLSSTNFSTGHMRYGEIVSVCINSGDLIQTGNSFVADFVLNGVRVESIETFVPNTNRTVTTLWP